MKLLLDTCTFLWLVDRPESLSGPARAHIADPSKEVFFSVVSAWEVHVKVGLGKLRLERPAHQLIAEQRGMHGIASLALEEPDVFHLTNLPAIHRDPFDRMLICQAISHGLAIVTPDPQIALYPVHTIW